MTDKNKLNESKKKWNKTKSKVVQIRLKNEDLVIVDKAAEKVNMKRSEFIRKTLFQEVYKILKE